MPTAVANADLVRGLYRAFTERDLAALEELIAEDAVWHVPGTNPLAGHHRGRLAIAKYFAALGHRTGGTFRVDVIDVLASESRAVAIARATGQRDGRSYDGLYCLLVSIERGVISEAWVMPADAFALDGFLT
jgi:ketosteroid isomerase-like protein